MLYQSIDLPPRPEVHILHNRRIIQPPLHLLVHNMRGSHHWHYHCSIREFRLTFYFSFAAERLLLYMGERWEVDLSFWVGLLVEEL